MQKSLRSSLRLRILGEARPRLQSSSQRNCATARVRRLDWAPSASSPSSSAGHSAWGRGRRPRTRNSCHEQQGVAQTLSPAAVPSPPAFAPSRPRTGLSYPSPPLWCLQPGGGSDPEQLTQLGHCLSPPPSDTPWAQRQARGSAATTQVAAPATLNCLPDHSRTPPNTPEKPATPPTRKSRGCKAIFSVHHS